MSHRAAISILAFSASLSAAVACGGGASGGDTSAGGGGGTSSSTTASSSGGGTTSSTSTGSGDTCTLDDDTTPTSTVSDSGCHVLDRDTAACKDARTAAGLSGFWLNFSCRVTLSVASGYVKAAFDGQPDYLSNYFQTSNPCHESYTGAIQNPNLIAPQTSVVEFPLTSDMSAGPMMSAIVGVALNGIPIFGDFAAPGDDIYQEAKTFDRCGGHPQMTGVYHYHAEPYSLSNDDDRFIGVMRDGYPIYGRKDADGSMPSLDAYGGHTGTTPDSPSSPVYHYHVNQQTSTNPMSAGQKQWFITTGKYRGTPAPCGSCN